MLPKLQRPDLQSEGRQRSRQLPGLPGGRRARASEQGWQVELAQSVIRVCHGPFRQHPRQCAGPRLSAVQTLPAPRGAGRKVRAQAPPRPPLRLHVGLDLRRFGPTSVMPGDKSRQQNWPASDTKLCALRRQALGYGRTRKDGARTSCLLAEAVGSRREEDGPIHSKLESKNI